MKFVNLEKLLPFGYLILVILGIVKESVFYYQLGINILKYSNLMDILISPISDLTAHPLILVSFLFYIFLLFIGFSMVSKNPDKAWARSILEIKEGDPIPTGDALKIKVGRRFLSIVIFGVMCFFLGIGIGNGSKVSKKIKNNQLEFNHVFTFDAGEPKKVYVIGNNSSNFFYIEEGGKQINISPVGAIKKIELLK